MIWYRVGDRSRTPLAQNCMVGTNIRSEKEHFYKMSFNLKNNNNDNNKIIKSENNTLSP